METERGQGEHIYLCDTCGPLFVLLPFNKNVETILLYALSLSLSRVRYYHLNYLPFPNLTN